MAKISFVIPFYKVPYEYMQQSIGSVLNQTFRDIEVILVDDGSPDDCGKWCDEFKRTDSRIVVIHKKNGGLSDARNAGIAAATSEWLTFVDGDDWIEPDYCKDFVNRIESQKETADIYFYSGFRNYPAAEVPGVPHFADGTRFCTYEERENLQTKCCTIHLEKNGNRKGITISSAWAKIYKTSFIRENGLLFPIVPYDEDSIFYMYAIEAARSIEYVAKPVYHYRFTEGSIVNKYRPNADNEQDVYLSEMFGFAKKYNKSEAFIDKIYMRVMTSMLLSIKQYFFHSENSASFMARQRACKIYFRQEPYSQAFRHIPFSSLGNNAKIKYMLLRLKCYGIVERLRQYYSKNIKSL